MTWLSLKTPDFNTNVCCEFAGDKVKKCNEIFFLQKYSQLVFVLLLPFVTSCAVSAQAMAEQENSTRIIQQSNALEVKQERDDFSQIQSALTQMNQNLQKNQSARSAQSNPTVIANNRAEMTKMQQSSDSTADMDNNKMNMTMAKAKGKPMNANSPPMGMAMGPMESMMPKGMCMGKMCKLMMGNQSMMGAKPIQNAPQSLDISEVLPGYKNAPHIYHLGEIDFFLDQKEHLSLNSAQITALEGIKSKWLNFQSENVNSREKLEAKLWQLTSLGSPDWQQIKKTVSEIETINSSLRLTFIRLVGNAIEVLNVEQINELINIGMTNDV